METFPQPWKRKKIDLLTVRMAILAVFVVVVVVVVVAVNLHFQ